VAGTPLDSACVVGTTHTHSRPGISSALAQTRPCGVVWCGVVWCGAVRCRAAKYRTLDLIMMP
jgi:hypothetical protein